MDPKPHYLNQRKMLEYARFTLKKENPLLYIRTPLKILAMIRTEKYRFYLLHDNLKKELKPPTQILPHHHQPPPQLHQPPPQQQPPQLHQPSQHQPSQHQPPPPPQQYQQEKTSLRNSHLLLTLLLLLPMILKILLTLIMR